MLEWLILLWLLFVAIFKLVGFLFLILLFIGVSVAIFYCVFVGVIELFKYIVNICKD
jgi:hypothetical protein